MEFNPNNAIVKLCIAGMVLEEKGDSDEAGKLFLQAWHNSTGTQEKFISAYYVARTQKGVSDKLQWLETALQLALEIDDDSVRSALPALYENIARCYQESGDPEKARMNSELSSSSRYHPSDKGPFYHGTRANLKVGDLLTAGGDSNYKTDLRMNHIYFTALANNAGLAASLAKGEGPERVYIVEPIGTFENDPNVTDKKFPGNPTRSYRSETPLKVVGEITDWVKQTPEQLRAFREKLANNKGEIIN